jgi:hypothetical protein
MNWQTLSFLGKQLRLFITNEKYDVFYIQNEWIALNDMLAKFKWHYLEIKLIFMKNKLQWSWFDNCVNACYPWEIGLICLI